MKNHDFPMFPWKFGMDHIHPSKLRAALIGTFPAPISLMDPALLLLIGIGLGESRTIDLARALARARGQATVDGIREEQLHAVPLSSQWKACQERIPNLHCER